MLSCSLRVGPEVDGKPGIWHLEEKAGADIVVTCPPSFIDELINFPTAENIKFDADRIDVDPPKEVMEKLLRIPYFERAYDEDGYTRDEYNTHPALVKTAEQFSKATNEMVEFAGSCLAQRPDRCDERTVRMADIKDRFVPWVMTAPEYSIAVLDKAWAHPEFGRMMLNENPVPPSDKVVEAVANIIKQGNRYPDRMLPAARPSWASCTAWPPRTSPWPTAPRRRSTR